MAGKNQPTLTGTAMSGLHPFTQLMPSHLPVQPSDDSKPMTFIDLWNTVVDGRWLIAGCTALALAAGAAYAFLAKPIFEANLLVQVEDSASSAKNMLSEAASIFDVKTPATAEIEIIRSRMVIGQAVDETRLYIDAVPHYLPVIGGWLARNASGLSSPGIFGFGGWVSGTERIRVQSFAVPPSLEGTSFRLTAGEPGSYVLTHPSLRDPIPGAIGSPLNQTFPSGTLTLVVESLDAKPGAAFQLKRHSKMEVVENLQRNLRLTERGRQSGVIDATLQDTDRSKLTLILNEIGRQYVKQNVERKAAEAQKTLEFLGLQLPQFKKQLEQSEEAYNRYRNVQGTVSLDEEAKLILMRDVELRGKLIEAQQRRRDLVSRFTPEHPSIKTLDDQIAAWQREISGVNERVKGLPNVQQNALRLERDVRVNNELYQQLRNNSLQLQLIREGKVGNVRLIDSAVLPEMPVKPHRGLILAVSLLIGIILGVVAAGFREFFVRGIRTADEIESSTGLSVYATIPISPIQQSLSLKAEAKHKGNHLLADTAPNDSAVESLRSLRTALQFSMLEAANNRVLITGATPGVGKSFVSANFAAVLASAGKRVLLIDGDLRKGYLNQYFGRGRSPGFSELIAGTATIAGVVQKDVLENLDIIPTGTLPPNPAELMMSSACSATLRSLSERYDLVIIDTPPVLAAADALGVAGQAGTVLVVARAGQTEIGELVETTRRLAQSGKVISGVLFNGLDLTRQRYGRYANNYARYAYRNYDYQPAQR